jgi:hypothetical protein
VLVSHLFRISEDNERILSNYTPPIIYGGEAIAVTNVVNLDLLKSMDACCL